jgi:hypothetical protein
MNVNTLRVLLINNRQLMLCYHRTQTKNALQFPERRSGVNDGARTHDPRYHKPML